LQLHNDKSVPITRAILRIFTAHAQNGHISISGLKSETLKIKMVVLDWFSHERMSPDDVLRLSRDNVSRRLAAAAGRPSAAPMKLTDIERRSHATCQRPAPCNHDDITTDRLIRTDDDKNRKSPRLTSAPSTL